MIAHVPIDQFIHGRLGGNVPATHKIIESSDKKSDAARCKRNIADWNTYLPKNCVDEMIAAG